MTKENDKPNEDRLGYSHGCCDEHYEEEDHCACKNYGHYCKAYGGHCYDYEECPKKCKKYKKPCC